MVLPGLLFPIQSLKAMANLTRDDTLLELDEI